MEDLQGKVAVITGGASGIGRAVADRAAAEGMKIVLGDIEEGPLAAAVDELAAAGAEAIGVRTDVADRASVEALRDRALDRFGAVHLVHNNAGIGLGGPIWEVTEEDWRWILGVNLWGVIHGVATFTPLLIEQGEGHIVNTASIAGLIVAPFLGPYNATKQAVVAISETLFKDLQAVARRSASRCSAPASCRRALPSRTGTGPTGPPTATSEGAPRCRAWCRTWSTAASHPPPWRTASSTPSAPTPSTSSPTPSSTSPSRRASTTLCRDGRPARR